MAIPGSAWRSPQNSSLHPMVCSTNTNTNTHTDNVVYGSDKIANSKYPHISRLLVVLDNVRNLFN